MDNKRLVIGMVLAMAVVMGWQMFVGYMYEKNPHWRPQEQKQTAQDTAPGPATDVGGTPATGVGVERVTPTTGATISTQAVATNAPVTNAAAEPTLVELGAGDPRGDTFPLKLTLTSTGGGIDLATLKRYKDHEAKDVYTFQSPPTSDPHTRPLATQTVVVNGTSFDLAGLHWNLEPGATDRTAAFSLDLSSGDAPLVRVRTSYEIFDATHPSAGYDVAIRQTFQNLTEAPLRIAVALNGPVLPPRELERGPDRHVVAGYLDGTKTVEAKQEFIESFDDATPHNYLLDDKGRPLLWGGGASVYFNALLRPEPREPGSAVPKYLAKVEARALDPQAPPPQRQVTMQFATGDLDVAPKATLDLPMSLYLGPKHREILNRKYYAAFPRSYDATLVIKNEWCGICTFQWLVSSLVAMLGWFYTIFRDWGLAIITLVVIVRVLLHPITKRSQISMMKMGKMGPEIERLKKKYGDNKDELNKAMMQVYKEQGFTPILGCLPMFLQMPIWIALYAALNSTFELRQAPFLWGWTWIEDLARPDRLIEWQPIHLFWGIEIGAFNLLPILLAVVFYLQQEFTPKPPATTPEQVQQQKMMKWMSLIFPVFLYNGPSGLNLYILTSTTIGIIESKRIRDHIREREEAEKAGKVIVDAKPTRHSKKKDAKDKDEPKKRTGLGGWLADLQAKAEEIRRQADKKRG
ncbi:MAG TPA: YidC/Oxa1 family insertase periplasmic-domain containing protein [Tepidisphaeraceae bacterium]|nr:YidC/Oxa1 family insertase periplasmic-domain containing protein [Tepidisphaeraceae bacterium]